MKQLINILFCLFFASLVNAQTIPKSINKPLTVKPAKPITKPVIKQKAKKEVGAYKQAEKTEVANKEQDQSVSQEKELIDRGFIFFEGLAIAVTHNKQGYITTKGEWAFPATFDKAIPVVNGFARVKNNEKWGFINKKGIAITNFKYEDAGDFDISGYAWAIRDHQKYLIDQEGNEIIYNTSAQAIDQIDKDDAMNFLKSAQQMIVGSKMKNDYLKELTPVTTVLLTEEKNRLTVNYIMETVGGEFGINREFNPSGILAIVLEKSEFAGLQKIELLLSSYTDGSSTEYLISADFGDSGGSVNTSTVCIYFPVAISFDTIKEKLEKLKKSWKK
jgi:hypothetical protein